MTAEFLKRQWRPLTAVAVVVALTLGTLGWFVFRDDRETTTIKLDDNVTMRVEADLGGGKVVHQALAELPVPLQFAKPLTKAVRLSVEGGKIDGDARVGFSVPSTVQVPAGLTVADAVTIATRAETPGAEWEEAGGIYDASTRMMWADTDHFSDWILTITDPTLIERNVKNAKQASSSYLSKQFIDTAVGQYAPASCTDPETLKRRGISKLVLVPGAVNDPARPGLEVCIGYLAQIDPALGEPGYYMEVSNPHNFPLVLDLPSSVVKHDVLNPNTGTLHDLYRISTEDADEARFQPRENRAFKIKQKALAEADNYLINGGLDYTTFLVDLALSVFDLAAEDTAGKVSADKQAAITDALKVQKGVDCVYQAIESYGRELADASMNELFGKALDATREVVNKCVELVLIGANAFLAKQVNTLSRFLPKGTKNALKLFLAAPDIADTIREYTSTLSQVWRSAFDEVKGQYKVAINLRPQLKNYGHVIPPPDPMFVARDGGDPRTVLPGAQSTDVRFLEECTRPGTTPPEANWFVGAQASGAVLGVANYDLYQAQGPYDAAYLAFGVFSVGEVKADFQDKLAVYLNGALDTCSNGGFTYKKIDGVPAAPEAAIKFMQVEDGSSGAFAIKATNGKWLIQAQISHNGLVRMSSTQMRPFINEVMAAVFLYAAAVTGTQFARQ